MFSDDGGYAKIAAVAVLLLVISNMGLGFLGAETVSFSVAEGDNAIIEIVNSYFMTGERQMESMQQVIYEFMLPLGLVALIIFVGLETAGFGGSNNTRLSIAIILALMMTQTGLYGAMSEQIAQASGPDGYNIVNIVQNMGSTIFFSVLGLIIFEIGMTSGSFGGIIMGLFGLGIMFFSLTGLDFAGIGDLALYGGVGTIVLFAIVVGLGYMMMRGLSHGGGHH